MKARRPVYQTQWAAQFAVASELCKRGYQVALTLGNHPVVDLMVRSPTGKAFGIDVKGLYKRNYWPITLKEIRKDLFYVLAFVPTDKHNEYFVMTQQQVGKAIQANWDRYCIRHGIRKCSFDVDENRMPGVDWKDAEQYRGRWNILPE